MNENYDDSEDKRASINQMGLDFDAGDESYKLMQEDLTLKQTGNIITTH